MTMMEMDDGSLLADWQLKSGSLVCGHLDAEPAVST